jgi:hypothetical protein
MDKMENESFQLDLVADSHPLCGSGSSVLGILPLSTACLSKSLLIHLLLQSSVIKSMDEL